jgi:hypothetical protein
MTRPLVLLCFSLFLCSCAVTEIVGITHPKVTGTLAVQQADGTQVHWTPDICASGGFSYFYGVDFQMRKGDGQLRALVDPIAGPVVRWQSGSGAAQRTEILRPADCSSFDFDVHDTGVFFNDVREFAAEIQLQCTAADGARIQGRVKVDHCH